MSVPIYINTRDRLSPLLLQLEWFQDRGQENITIVDNASTYPPMVDFLESCEHNVVRLEENMGHLAPWTTKTVNTRDYYIVTDPDVLPDKECPEDVFTVLCALLKMHKECIKVGLALRIDDIPDSYILKREVLAWEGKHFWGRDISKGVGPPVYVAPVDTTFAMYRPGIPTLDIHPALRVAGPYQARHLSWYLDSENPTEEDVYYHEHAARHITTWTGKEIPEVYKPYL